MEVIRLVEDFKLLGKDGNRRFAGLVLGFFIIFSIFMVGGAFAQGGLVAEYHFDGNASDSSGNGNHGTIYGNAAFRSGINGQALDLDGVDDYVEVLSSESLKLNESVSISLWFKTESAIAAQTLVHKSTNHLTNNYWLMINPFYTYIFWHNGLTGNNYVDINPYIIENNTWYFISVTAQAGEKGKIFINGYEVSPYLHQLNTSLPFLTDDNPVQIGTDYNNNSFKGLIDELKIYNKVLSPEEILSEYESYPSNDLVAEYHFEGNASDSSGYRNHGTLMNGASFASGINGQALYLDGLDDFVEVISSESLKLNESVSISLWYKTESNITQTLIQKSESYDIDNYWLMISPIYEYYYWDYGIATDVAYVNPKNIMINLWYHIAVTIEEGEKGRIYVNGNEASYATQSNAPNPLLVDNNPLKIGTDFNNNSFKGLIDEIKIFNRVLTPTEIETIYNQTLLAACNDSDLDGYTDSSCGGTDCNDSNPDINPGASELECDGIDNDCNILTEDDPQEICDLNLMEEWSVPINVTSGIFEQELIFGADDNGTDNFDFNLDVPSPPPQPGSIKHTYFMTDDFIFNSLLVDYRSILNQSNPRKSWSLLVTSDETTNLIWNSINVPDNILTLKMDINGTRIDMKKMNNYTFPSGTYEINITADLFLEIPLKTGWNMISLPVRNATMTIPSGVIPYAYWYNSSTGSYALVDINNLETGKGYWVASVSDNYISATGLPLKSYSSNLSTGWNMIGGIYTDSEFSSLIVTPPNSVLPYAYWYNPQTGSYLLTNKIEQKKGYWAAAINDCQIQLEG